MLNTIDFHHASGTVMGGPWQIKHRPTAGCDPVTVAKAAEAALRLVDAQMSPYREDSDLMKLNTAPLGRFVDVPPEMMEVLQCADRWARLSEGALNIGLGQLVNKWGFGPDPAPESRLPTDETDTLKAQAYLGSFALRENPPAVIRHEPISLDLCGLAKGYAVDLAAKTVEALGVSDFLIEAAGEIVAKGDGPNGLPWKIGLELPVCTDQRVIYDEIELSGASATSGNYRKFHQIDGTTVSHTIDPESGAPSDNKLLSVTVFHESCMEADALATILMVLGPNQGPAFAKQHSIASIFLSPTETGLKEERTGLP